MVFLIHCLVHHPRRQAGFTNDLFLSTQRGQHCRHTLTTCVVVLTAWSQEKQACTDSIMVASCCSNVCLVADGLLQPASTLHVLCKYHHVVMPCMFPVLTLSPPRLSSASAVVARQSQHPELQRHHLLQLSPMLQFPPVSWQCFWHPAGMHKVHYSISHTQPTNKDCNELVSA